MTAYSAAYPAAGAAAHSAGVVGLGDAVRRLLRGHEVLADGRILLNGWTDQRASSLWLPDHEGVVREIPGGVPALVDPATGRTPRIVRNWMHAGQDITQWSHKRNVATPDANTIVFTPADSDTWGGYDSLNIRFSNNAAIGVPAWLDKAKRAVIRVCLSGIDGETLRIYCAVSGGRTADGAYVRTVTLTAEPRWYTIDMAPLSDNSTWTWGPNFYIDRQTSHTATTVHFHGIQIEDATGAATGYVPSEFIGTEEIVYFATANGNSVDNATGVVTDGIGASLGSSYALAYYPGATNFFLNSNTPATQTITLNTPGSYTLSIIGAGSASIAAGTATGSGFGTATEGNPVTVTLTGAGSVDVTISGAVDWCQLEDNLFSTPMIATTGAPVTRDRCDLIIPSLTAWDNPGTLFADFQYSVANTEITNNAVFGFSGKAGVVLYVGATHRVQSTDEVVYPYVSSSDWAANERVKSAVHWGPDQFGVSFKGAAGTWVHGVENSYDGAFASDGQGARLFYSNQYPAYLYGLELVNCNLGTAGIEQRWP